VRRLLPILLALPLLLAPRYANLEPIQVVSEFYSDSYAPLGCIGEDEQQRFLVKGDLAPGQSYTYTPPIPACYFRILKGNAWYRTPGNGDPLHVTIRTDYGWSVEGGGCAVGLTRISAPEPFSWSVTVENRGSRAVRDVQFAGFVMNEGDPSGVCP